MYYYISFLRPPPLQSPLTAPITITPQVSNDLRTEPYPDPIDIFYAWTLPSAAPVTRPTKLTTWRQANAYKELSIAPPPALRDGAQCCLMLTAAPTVGSSTIDLLDAPAGRVPLPVSSLPITFRTGLGAGKGAKQEAIERAFRLGRGTAGAVLRIREQTSFDLDKKLWDSGIGLSAWLAQISDEEGSVDGRVADVKDTLFGLEGADVIELGAGTGIVSMALAAISHSRTESPSQRPRILTTDLPSSMELMAHNVAQNMPLYPENAPIALTLDWDATLPPAVSNVPGGFHAIIMADVTYNTASFPALMHTLKALLALPERDQPDTDAEKREKETLIVLAYKQRDAAERGLWDLLAQETGVRLVLVGGRVGAGAEAVEVWVGRRGRN